MSGSKSFLDFFARMRGARPVTAPAFADTSKASVDPSVVSPDIPVEEPRVPLGPLKTSAAAKRKKGKRENLAREAEEDREFALKRFEKRPKERLSSLNDRFFCFNKKFITEERGCHRDFQQRRELFHCDSHPHSLGRSGRSSPRHSPGHSHAKNACSRKARRCQSGHVWSRSQSQPARLYFPQSAGATAKVQIQFFRREVFRSASSSASRSPCHARQREQNSRPPQFSNHRLGRSKVKSHN